MNFSLCLCECKSYKPGTSKIVNKKIKMIKILTKQTGLPNFSVISSAEGKSSCKAYFLMSSVMLAQGKLEGVASLNIQETLIKQHSHTPLIAIMQPSPFFVILEKEGSIIVPYIPCTITSIYLFLYITIVLHLNTMCILLYCYENHNTMQFVQYTMILVG